MSLAVVVLSLSRLESGVLVDVDSPSIRLGPPQFLEEPKRVWSGCVGGFLGRHKTEGSSRYVLFEPTLLLPTIRQCRVRIVV